MYSCFSRCHEKVSSIIRSGIDKGENIEHFSTQLICFVLYCGVSVKKVLIMVDAKDLTVTELKEILRSQGLATIGNKTELVLRIEKAYADLLQEANEKSQRLEQERNKMAIQMENLRLIIEKNAK